MVGSQCRDRVVVPAKSYFLYLIPLRVNLVLCRDAATSMLIMGVSGTGKTTLLKYILRQMAENTYWLVNALKLDFLKGLPPLEVYGTLQPHEVERPFVWNIFREADAYKRYTGTPWPVFETFASTFAAAAMAGEGGKATDKGWQNIAAMMLYALLAAVYLDLGEKADHKALQTLLSYNTKSLLGEILNTLNSNAGAIPPALRGFIEDVHMIYRASGGMGDVIASYVTVLRMAANALATNDLFTAPRGTSIIEHAESGKVGILHALTNTNELMLQRAAATLDVMFLVLMELKNRGFKRPVVVVVDDAGMLPKLSMLENLVNIGRGLGLYVYVTAQNPKQLDKHSQNLANNFRVNILFQLQGEDAEWGAKMLGALELKGGKKKGCKTHEPPTTDVLLKLPNRCAYVVSPFANKKVALLCFDNLT